MAGNERCIRALSGRTVVPLLAITDRGAALKRCKARKSRDNRVNPSLRSIADLLRIHFFFAWPLLFCSGLVLAFVQYDTFSWNTTAKAVLIAFFGFEGGFVINDFVDRRYDTRDVDGRLTRYWRPFGTRPLVGGALSARQVIAIGVLLIAAAAALTLTLPRPHNIYVLVIGVYSYTAEILYQLGKRSQHLPFAQLIGRTDFALFPAAGYLCAGFPDTTALLYVLFFYPFALAHLGVNDLADEENDRAREMQTVTVLYGRRGSAWWIGGFTLLHFALGLLFATRLGIVGQAGIVLGNLLLLAGNYWIFRSPDPASAIRVLPIFHATMICYTIAIIADAAIRIA